MTLPILTNSRLKTFRSCPQEDAYKYVQGYRLAVEPDALRFGTLFHNGLEAWWRSTGDRYADAMAALQGEADAYDRAKAEAMLVAYHERWAQEPLEVLGVEAEFNTELRGPGDQVARAWRLGGKIDAIVRDAEGRVLIVEHKTSSEDLSPGSDYWQRLVLDSQVSIYFDGAASLGHHVDGCLYDVIGKPALKPYKATPAEARTYTKEKSRACPECKKKKATPAPHTIDGLTCSGGRLVTDAGGVLHANQREADETPDEYRARVAEALAADRNAYLRRETIVRLPEELEAARRDTWQWATAIQLFESTGMAPKNPDACRKYGRTCAFAEVCAGRASLDDAGRFRRSENTHPELSNVHP
jgi:hypothetical protein